MRMANHRAPGFFQQLRLFFGSALTYKLYVLSSQIGAIKLQLEVRWIILLIYPPTDGSLSQLALDEQQLSSDIDLESGITAMQPCPAVGTHLISDVFRFYDVHQQCFLQSWPFPRLMPPTRPSLLTWMFNSLAHSYLLLVDVMPVLCLYSYAINMVSITDEVVFFRLVHAPVVSLTKRSSSNTGPSTYLVYEVTGG